MFRAIHSNLFHSQQEKMLKQARIDKTHHFLVQKTITHIANSITTKAQPQYLILLTKKLSSSNLTLRLKSLILLHNCLRQGMDNQLIDFVMCLQHMGQCPEDGGLDEYIKQKVVNFYLSYLKKIVMHNESYTFVKQRSCCGKDQMKKQDKMKIVGHGFQILNISNYMLTSQQMFNKMGRYHPSFSEIVCLYMELLKDMNYYNLYIKKTVRHFTDLNIAQETNRPLLEKVSVSLQPAISQKQTAQVRHVFLYIHEAQKLSDKLYEFYHNRYYFQTVRQLIKFPIFLEVPIEQYDFLRSKAKRVDRNLVKMVAVSKYDDKVHFHTEGKLNSTSQSIKRGGNLITDIRELEGSSRVYENIKADFLDPERQGEPIKGSSWLK